MTRAEETGKRRPASRGGWWVIWALVLAVVTTPTLSRAENPCANANPNPIPDCQTQIQAPIT
jgi:hypothetical protein